MTGDISDWRMVVLISGSGISAFLKNTADSSIPYETLLDEHWEADDSMLLGKIEGAVYDNPRILDDFSSEIIINAPKALWIPADFAEDDDDFAAQCYNRIYSASPEDIMTDDFRSLVNVYSLTPGLLPFLQRTFPGARFSNHLTVLARKFVSRPSDVPAFYIDIARAEADILLFDGSKLLCGAMHRWRHYADIEYMVMNMIDVYDLNPDAVAVNISGLRETRIALLESLRDKVATVMNTMLPAAAKEGLPLAAALSLSRI